MKNLSSISPVKIADGFFFAGGLLSILWSIYFSLITISIPYQIELREGASQVMTEVFLHGGNPFVFDNQPLAMNNYGITYNLVVLPFAMWFGNTLLVYRSITFLFVIGSSVLGFLMVKKETKSNPLAITCTAFIMTALIGRGSIGAFPTTMGVFLFLFSVFFPFLRNFDKRSLVVSAFVSVIAFHTKAYFVLSFGIVLSYLFLFVSKRRSFFYFLIFLLIFFTSTLLIRLAFPLYFINTLMGNISNASMSSVHLFNQLRELFFIFSPALAVLLIYFIGDLWKKQFVIFHETEELNRRDVARFDFPLFNILINYFFYAFLCSLLAFLFILGPHIGNYLNYAYQLLVPTFFIWLLRQAALREKMKLMAALALLFNLFIWQRDLLDPVMLKQRQSPEWAQVMDHLHASSVTLNSAAVTSELIALGQMPMDSGQTTYYYSVQPFSENFLIDTPYSAFFDDGFRYTLLIDRMIEKQRFTLVVTTREKANFYHDKLLWDYYYQVDEITVEMPQTNQQWTLVFWKPLIK